MDGIGDCFSGQSHVGCVGVVFCGDIRGWDGMGSFEFFFFVFSLDQIRLEILVLFVFD